MVSKEDFEKIKNYVLNKFNDASIALTEEEKNKIEIADFGLGRINEIGLQLLTYVNTNRCCGKELVLMPFQICPEHRHPPFDGTLGKEETFRCRQGEVYLYVEGGKNNNIKGTIPDDLKEKFTVFHEIILKKGEQYTLSPNIKHWFQAGKDGCIVSEFSTASRDDLDIFTDKDIVR